jgi:hypothetical protein
LEKIHGIVITEPQALATVKWLARENACPTEMQPFAHQCGQTLSSVKPAILIHSPLIQPVVQFYDNVGGREGRAVVVGFRTKLEL